MKTRNSLLLLLTSMIWGVAFVFQTTGGNATGPYTFACIRNIIGAIALLPVIRLLDGMGLTERRPASREDWKTLIKGGILCGLCLAATSVFQQLGLYMGTAAGKAGFLTACYIVLVPLLGLFLKRSCGWTVWIAVGVTVVGLYLLCINGTLSFQLSDAFILLCSLACALHILVVDRFMLRVEVVRMSCIQFITAAIVAAFPMYWFDMGHSLTGLQEWLQRMGTADAWTGLLYAGLLSSAIGYTLQCIGQQGINPTVASLLMSLESVFSVISGWLILGQTLSSRELLGCALIFIAVVFAQLPQPAPKKKM